MPLLPPPPLPPPPALVESVEVESPGHAPAAFEPGAVEVKVRLAFTGANYGPWSLFTSFLSWNELQLTVDGSVYKAGDLSIGLGAEAYYGQPWFLQLLSRTVVGASTDLNLRWRLVETGVAARATFHYSNFEILDPYAVLLAGPSLTRFRARVDSDDLRGNGNFSTAGLRAGMGVGVAGVAPNGFTAGLELRYLVGVRFRTTDVVELDDVSGDTVELFEWSGNQRPTSGFSWVFSAGYRF
ncbi:MAG: hypothetical protein KC912_17060 [Proteobacteria bacterium]|nr:hypothetical protein [Pseudomonadota bacterium]